MNPDEFVSTTLRQIRSIFYVGVSDKRFFQERPRLIKAITYPAEWLNRLGARAPASLYKKILQTVIDAIRRHGNRAKIQRFEVYFLHSVQEHMAHHGDEYYQEAKAPRHVAAILPGMIGRIRERSGHVVGDGGPTTRLLAELHESIKIGGRPRSKLTDSAPDLFGHCNSVAGPPQRPKKFLKPLQKTPHGAQTPQIGVSSAVDS